MLWVLINCLMVEVVSSSVTLNSNSPISEAGNEYVIESLHTGASHYICNSLTNINRSALKCDCEHSRYSCELINQFYL